VEDKKSHGRCVEKLSILWYGIPNI
jgi:hypothetical protein